MVNQVKKKAATKALSKTMLGNWIYLKAKFVTACVQKKSLIDPKDFVFKVDQSVRAKFKTMKYISVAPQLLRQSNTLRHGSLTYHTAMRKYKNTLNRAALKNLPVLSDKVSLTALLSFQCISITYFIRQGPFDRLFITSVHIYNLFCQTRSH